MPFEINFEPVYEQKPKSKLGIEWLNLLKDKHLKRCIEESIIEQHNQDLLQMFFMSLGTFLNNAFEWKETVEGHDYWADIYRQIQLNEDSFLEKNKYEEAKSKLKI